MPSQAEKAARFRALHQRSGAFVIPNPWDPGTARILASLGFEALATTSLGVANMLGRKVTRQDVLDNCRAIAEATDLPVNADLENCFADDPKAAATMIRDAAEAGMVGASIEDFTGDRAKPIYDFSLTVERVAAAVEVAHAQAVPVMLTARAEGALYGPRNLDDAIRRLQAFEKVGADVLYAPGAWTIEEIRTMCAAVTKPVNLVMGFCDPKLTVARLADAGVKRISVGGALSRLALASFVKAAKEMREPGGFTWVADIMPMAELAPLLRPRPAA